MRRTIIRAALVAGLAAAAWTTWQAVEHTGARADDRPAVTIVDTVVEDVADAVDDIVEPQQTTESTADPAPTEQPRAVEPQPDQDPEPAGDEPEPQQPTDEPPPPAAPEPATEVLDPIVKPLPDLPAPPASDPPVSEAPATPSTPDPTPDAVAPATTAAPSAPAVERATPQTPRWALPPVQPTPDPTSALPPQCGHAETTADHEADREAAPYEYRRARKQRPPHGLGLAPPVKPSPPAGPHPLDATPTSVCAGGGGAGYAVPDLLPPNCRPDLWLPPGWCAHGPDQVAVERAAPIDPAPA